MWDFRHLLTALSVLHLADGARAATITDRDTSRLDRRAGISSVSKHQLQALNSTVHGRLFEASPLALPCFGRYQDGLSSKATVNKDVDPLNCANVRVQSSNSSYIVDSFGGYVSTNFAGCFTDKQACQYTVTGVPSVAGICSQGSIPSYYIDVAGPQDVAAGIAFARANNVPLVVKNTGHDFLGRSSAPGSLALWTHNLQPEIQFDQDFVPESCESGAGPALTYGAGQGFGGIYEKAHELGYMAVGGTSPTVGASGGWVLGGGHSALSTTLGLGVDNVLQMRVVLPNGTYITASRCQNQDMFFALRGGGGSAFGVLMETTSRLHPAVPLQMSMIIVTALSPNATDAVVDLILEVGPQWAADGWGGYVISTTKIANFYVVILLTPKLTLKQAKASMQPAINYAHSVLNGSIGLDVSVKTLPGSYWEFYQSDIAKAIGAQGVGAPSAFASRLIPKASVEGSGKSELASTLKAMVKKTPKVGFLMVVPSAYELPASDQPGGPGEASITPAWRSALFHTIKQLSWDVNDPTFDTYGSAQALYTAVSESMNPLREITPDSGSYQNEGDVYEPNFEQSFWGATNYARLQKIKAEIDPDNIFTCHQCVGFQPSTPSSGRYQCYPNVR